MIVIIKSEFNKEIVDGLLKGCKRALAEKEIKIISVPGAFELPAAAKNVSIQSNLPEAVITLGCVIKVTRIITITYVKLLQMVLWISQFNLVYQFFLEFLHVRMLNSPLKEVGIMILIRVMK